ncbi:hypothetical protein PHYBLDRAFT_145440 [Phycomyces blakesleeanus NRRL 1555(-)]|uniref:Reverse transcriptase domain-containing protein n=1 Tax=Phycomyces blakesleeanus (strain ATCC 8743b / DSM 1359 / FGSC 10004 / NBRC 33097 / NRRL 1555) TaxID=763407 RepID=A0A162PU24_PHYB8|nr:hypothetical protein PHYBLDRAFT_145440 [Phycomyces blakesleeanus NRRL 1555(-)]OAD73976.1 hypothetical protein PHYBLDRAFT_145440 [Phycomyces blakesleeanus NRRL 1555(-)]|eukprot:XP_018292016.1 hypothetical protein PHYBLDRAFT_145440 [Phycomyces blakesleeanus NRRL 1555(-)]
MIDHLENVFGGSMKIRTELAVTPMEREVPWDVDQVKETIRRFPRWKAPGIDHIRAEILKPLVSTLGSLLHMLFKLCWKLLEQCLAEELLLTIPELDIAQGGFRASRSTLDQALCLHELMRQYSVPDPEREQALKPPFVVFCGDPDTWFDEKCSVPWCYAETWSPAGPTATPLSLLEELRTITCNVSSVSRTEGDAPDYLPMSMAPINCLLYADNVALIGTPDDVQKMLTVAETHSNLLGYKWSPSKYEVLNAPPNSSFSLYGNTLPTCTSFKYLEFPFASQGIDRADMFLKSQQKACAATRKLCNLGVHMNGFGLPAALRAYLIFIRPILEYGLAIVPASQSDV